MKRFESFQTKSKICKCKDSEMSLAFFFFFEMPRPVDLGHGEQRAKLVMR